MESDAALAKHAFRNERLLEPLDLYNRFFTTFAGIFRELVDKLPEVTADPVNAELIAELVDGREREARPPDGGVSKVKLLQLPEKRR